MRSRCASTDHAAASQGEWKPHGRSPGSRALRGGDHRVLTAHLRPATPVDVQRQEPAYLSGGRVKITVAGQHHARGIPGLGHLRCGAAPVTLGTKHRAQPRPGWLAWQRRGGEALPEPSAGLQRPRAQDLELGHMFCHRLLRSITDTPHGSGRYRRRDNRSDRASVRQICR
jgi:hypothetical protein